LNMNWQELASWMVVVWRGVSGRWARRVYMLLFLICICLSAVLRFRTYLLTRRIQVVLAGLAQVRVDQTTESQLLKAVPDLVQYGGDRQRRASTERHYNVTISNDEEGYGMLGMHWSRSSFSHSGPSTIGTARFIVNGAR